MNVCDLLDRPIAFQRSFVRLGAGITGALMLSQAIYWTNRSEGRDGWFYKTQSDWEDETGMTRFEQEGARKKLRELGVLEEKKQGIPCKTYYRVNLETLQTRLLETSKQGSGKPADSAAENQQPITEITTETTTEIIADGKSPSTRASVPYSQIVDLYHEILPDLPSVRLMTKNRKAALRARWCTSDKTRSLGWWRDYFEVVRATPFLMGQNDRLWRADFDFLITESRFAKVIEGKYSGAQP